MPCLWTRTIWPSRTRTATASSGSMAPYFVVRNDNSRSTTSSWTELAFGPPSLLDWIRLVEVEIHYSKDRDISLFAGGSSRRRLRPDQPASCRLDNAH